MEIFTIKNNAVQLNLNCLTVPELKAVYEKYPDDYLNVFNYLRFMCDPKSPYMDFEAVDKENKLRPMLKGVPEIDLEIQDALNALEEIYNSSTTLRFFKNAKRMIDELGNYLGTARIDDSKETGNIQHVLRAAKEIPVIIKNFKESEKAYAEEAKKARGNAKISYDQ